MAVIIRAEQADDRPGIERVNVEAFGREEEAGLVEALRRAGAVILSLVAVDDEQVVGHILFSPMQIRDGEDVHEAVGLGPLAVLPERQGQGIGSALVTAGLAAVREAGHGVVMVLGHPEYYPRFGFRPASLHGIRWEYEAPDEAFMIIELRPDGLAGKAGVASYHPAFAGV